LLEDENGALKSELEVTRGLWEDVKRKNIDLSKQLSDQTTKMVNLQRLMVRAGRKDDGPMDGDIRQQFVLLKSDILQMVKNSLNLNLDRARPAASQELAELCMRQTVATLLYDSFFGPHAMPFGYDDHLQSANPLRNFEVNLRKSGCDGTSMSISSTII
jgi:hypothetical protein